MNWATDIQVVGNVESYLCERGKVVPGSAREGHNVFTVNGRNWLSKLVAWQTIGGVDVPYTQRRVRWMGVGAGSVPESINVVGLSAPLICTGTRYLSEIQAVEFPTTTSVRFIKEFSEGEVSLTPTPIQITEYGLYVDVKPASQGEDVPLGGGIATTLDPNNPGNSLVAYKTIEPFSKTTDLSLVVKWDFRF